MRRSHRRIDIIDGQHENLGVLGVSGAQQSAAMRPVKYFIAELPQEITWV